ncbi:hypothetical protein WDZ16_16195 [Pseudokineococcus marinus]|uniref:Uncharacterized protein n=1 Tax=Pseudokineococcus marinus TaxID=351215 RepID=A0A849BL94_9ACTN|nr:hypothetical protein [Pseudokineococcus marinus]NNH22093.1 hypothetical protein [Pseudokineococcus marinus]
MLAVEGAGGRASTRATSGAEDVSEALGRAASRADDRDVVVDLEEAPSSQEPGPGLVRLPGRDPDASA